MRYSLHTVCTQYVVWYTVDDDNIIIASCAILIRWLGEKRPRDSRTECKLDLVKLKRHTQWDKWRKPERRIYLGGVDLFSTQ